MGGKLEKPKKATEKRPRYKSLKRSDNGEMSNGGRAMKKKGHQVFHESTEAGKR